MLVQPQCWVGVNLQGWDDGRGVNQGEAKTEVPQDSGKRSQVEPLVVEAPGGGMEQDGCIGCPYRTRKTFSSVLQLPPAFAEGLVMPVEGFSQGMALHSPGPGGFL